MVILKHLRNGYELCMFRALAQSVVMAEVEGHVTHIHRSIRVIHANPHNLVIVYQNTADRGFVQFNCLFALQE